MKRIWILSLLLALVLPPGFLAAQNPETASGGDAPLAYCAANATYGAQYISSVRVGSIYTVSTLSANGYGDYSAWWTPMTVGTGYVITVNNGFGYASDQCAIWVDWNKDQDFADAGEQMTVAGTPGLGPYTATITPPASTTAGITRMRVRISAAGSFNSCGTTMYGETEDYSIDINGTPLTNDVGVISLITPVTGATLGALETVKVRVFNGGTAAQLNFPVSYSINGGTTVTETVTASVAPGTTYDYTFTQKANLGIQGSIYTLTSSTTLTGDQNSSNDGITRTIFHGWAQNQKVVQGEYFINTDPGEGNGIPITGTYNLVSVSVNITNLVLPVGSTVYVRFKSQNGKWSFPRSFRRQNYLPNLNATLTVCEYFLNTDPGQGNGTPVTITSGVANITNLAAPAGSRIYVRVKDSFGRWSQPRGIIRNNWFPNQNATLNYAEYFTGSDPGQGAGTALPVTGGIINLSNLNIPAGTAVYVRVKDSFNRWSYPRGLSRPAMITSPGSELAAVEYFINSDPGQGNGIPLIITSGIVQIDSLLLHRDDILYLRAKDSFNRWGPPRAIKYHFKDFQKAEYRVKLAATGTTTLPQPMQLLPPPDNTCGWLGLKTALAWNAGDTIWTRFQDQDGFYTNWKLGVVAHAGPDDTICQGAYATLSATGGGSIQWSNGMAGPVIMVNPTTTTLYWVTVSDGSGASSTDSVRVIVLPIPSPAGTISGLTEVCAGSNATAYLVPVIPNATAYQWTLPPGATGTSNTNSILVTFPSGAVSGNISVKGINACGQGTASASPITVRSALPGPAGMITGPVQVNNGATNITYSIELLSTATSYLWTVPPGATIVSGIHTNVITVDFALNAVSGNISVHGVNACGNGVESPLLPVNVIAAVPPLLSLTNKIIESGSNQCFNATQTITVAGNGTLFLVQNGGSVTLIAGHSIILKPGTIVQPGGYLDAHIADNDQYCTQADNPLIISSGQSVAMPTQDQASNLEELPVFRIYPNPTSGVFTISADREFDADKVSVKILNLMGTVIFDRQITFYGAAECSLEHGAPGIYLISITCGNHHEVKRIIRQ